MAGLGVLVLSWLKSKWLYVLGALAVAGAVLAVLAGVKNAGRNAEKVEQMRRVEDARRERLRIERDVRALPPAERERMLEKYYRD